RSIFGLSLGDGGPRVGGLLGERRICGDGGAELILALDQAREEGLVEQRVLAPAERLERVLHGEEPRCRDALLLGPAPLEFLERAALAGEPVQAARLRDVTDGLELCDGQLARGRSRVAGDERELPFRRA